MFKFDQTISSMMLEFPSDWILKDINTSNAQKHLTADQRFKRGKYIPAGKRRNCGFNGISPTKEQKAEQLARFA